MGKCRPKKYLGCDVAVKCISPKENIILTVDG